MPHRVGKLILSSFFFLALATTSLAADRSLRFAYSAIDTSFLPSWIAKEAGLFDKNKLFRQVIAIMYISAHRGRNRYLRWRHVTGYRS
jgi:hypothetical protein